MSDIDKIQNLFKIDRIELLEIAAKTTLINEFLNQKNCISEADLKKIAELKP